MSYTADDFFIFDSECHLVPKSGKSEISYFPQRDIWFEHCASMVNKLLGIDKGEGVFGETTAEAAIAAMDEGGVDMACLIPEKMMEMSGMSSPLSTNGYILDAVQRYPDRFIFTPNLGPITFRGMKNVLWELEHLHREYGVKSIKYYPPGDTYINDPQLWPFWEKCEELGIVAFIHTGNAYVYPMGSKYCHPHQLEDVMCDFPELRVLAFHLGYPWVRELAMMTGAFPHLYTSMSALIFRARKAPRWFAEILGEVLYWAGPEKTLWSVDWLNQVSYKDMVEFFLEFQLPEDLREGYGYAPITHEDRKNMFGLNLARLLGVEPTLRGPKAARAADNAPDRATEPVAVDG